jgi:hypothetical protein
MTRTNWLERLALSAAKAKALEEAGQGRYTIDLHVKESGISVVVRGMVAGELHTLKRPVQWESMLNTRGMPHDGQALPYMINQAVRYWIHVADGKEAASARPKALQGEGQDG